MELGFAFSLVSANDISTWVNAVLVLAFFVQWTVVVNQTLIYKELVEVLR